MNEKTITELRRVAKDLRRKATELRSDGGWPDLDHLEKAANEADSAWSGSSIGFHALVYYAGLEPPPPGAHFSQEWGFLGQFQGTTGDWREYRREDVLGHIEKLAGHPDIRSLESAAGQLRDDIDRKRSQIQSILSICLDKGADNYLSKVAERVQEVQPLTFDLGIKVQLPRGSIMSRDGTALQQGVGPAPHQEVLARVVAVRSTAKAAEDLADLSEQATAHIARRNGQGGKESPGSRVFIGHGRSGAWRELKDFVSDRLQLHWDEFNRTPTAGRPHTARLAEMLESAGMALLVLTAEDEMSDGKRVGRQNVIHEAGLFQGRLGWSRAIILLEEGCEEFSNIEGLGQIRFPPGQISASFEEVRRVLERESLI